MTHMPLGVIRPVDLGAGGHLLWSSAFGQQATYQVEQLGIGSEDFSTTRYMLKACPCPGNGGILIAWIRLATHFSANRTGMVLQHGGYGTQRGTLQSQDHNSDTLFDGQMSIVNSHATPYFGCCTWSLGFVRKVAALAHAVSKASSKCSFTVSKLRFLAGFSLPDLRSPTFRKNPRTNIVF
jgi:hypothetical protein